MEINFEQLKKQMDEMLSEYKRALNNGDYAKAKDITVAVLQLFRDTYKVQLDTNPEFDHIFHEVMTKMQTELRNSRPTTEEATDHEVEIINMFSAVADGVFKVSDIIKSKIKIPYWAKIKLIIISIFSEIKTTPYMVWIPTKFFN